MNFQWIYYNTTTGELAPQHSTHSPMVTTTTDGQTTTQFDSSLIPPNNEVIGPYDDSGNNDAPADFVAAFANPQAYLYQDGAFVANPAYDANAVALAQAQQTQLSAIQAGYNATIAAGFTSNATGQSDTYAIDETAYPKWTGILSVIAAGIGPQTIQVKDLAGNTVTLTADQFKTFALDGFNFLNAQEQQLWSLEAQINAATTVADVQAITWTPGAYTPQPVPTDSSGSTSTT